ncbi:MAG: hypothetical protein K6G87_09415 [Butyrivibrio sp.]|uniref:hypothetical protein n=1 Tax=Butyrivibrio sp. TaxID=28121 RepID=UPI0025F675A4|nr:hypothetical protein [Butyrivibrio sp.]MCR5771434.1 hypothetical protein [Butyrivibrio sp.]
MLKKIVLLLCAIILTLTGCMKYPGEYVCYIDLFGPNTLECHSFYHYKRVGNGLEKSGLQRYDLITETEQEIYAASDPHKQLITSYWGDDNEVYYVVKTNKKGSSEFTLFYYNLNTKEYQTVLDNEKSLSVFKDINTNRIIIIRDKQRYYITTGNLQEIDNSDVTMNTLTKREDVIRRVKPDGTVIEICKKYDNSEYTCKVNGTSYDITALSHCGGKESGLTNSFVIEGDLIIGIVQITKGTRGLVTTDIIRSDQLKKELLVSINYQTGESDILYNTKNNSTRIIGYRNGNIYLLKQGTIICRNLSDGSEKESYNLLYDGDNQLSFSWIGSRLIIYDEDDQQVIANIQT